MRAADVVAAVNASVLSALPIFLVAALAEQIRAALDFGVTALGVSFSIYYLSAALTSVPASRAVEAIGGLRSMRLGSLATGVLLLAFAAAVTDYYGLIVLMVLTGAVSASLQPATNLFLIRRIPDRRRGMAFGLKQAAVPVAVALSGFSVPAVALTIGWRWAFVITGAAAIATAVALPRAQTSLSAYRRSAPIPRLDRQQMRRLLVTTIGFAIGISAVSALSSFTVTALAATGLSQANAGILAALGGVIAGATRVAVGFGADRSRHTHMSRVIVMLLIGGTAFGAVALASAGLTALLLPALAIAFAAGWGWNGLFSLAIATTYPDQAARATGVTSVGGRTGGVVGPFVFGVAATHGGYPLAWLIAALAALAGAIIIGVGHRL